MDCNENSFVVYVNRLENWYSRYGFKTYTDENDDFKYIILNLV